MPHSPQFPPTQTNRMSLEPLRRDAYRHWPGWRDQIDYAYQLVRELGPPYNLVSFGLNWRNALCVFVDPDEPDPNDQRVLRLFYHMGDVSRWSAERCQVCGRNVDDREAARRRYEEKPYILCTLHANSYDVDGVSYEELLLLAGREDEF